MPFAVGSRVGPYEVLIKLGEGGMGEVYRARDTKLGRDVALKILSAAVAGDAERIARFEREARTLAALNQPHIAHIYGFEQSVAGPALVMELVEGEDLAARIKRGALPLDEALPIARQIAEALEAAHEAGIIHRDLKPANIKVRPDGAVKVLDFGLAKALDSATAASGSGPGQATQSPTITTPAMTLRGVILGTAAYMAPEQAKGRAVTKRADVWALGCVLFEMLSGQRPFDGDDMTEVLASVIKTEPDWSRLPHDVPPAISALIHGCLEKDPAKRVADAAVVRYTLDHLADVGPSMPVGRSTRRVRTGAITAAAAIVIAAAMGAPLMLKSTPSLSYRFAVVPPAALPLAPTGTARDIAIAPDGRHIVYRTIVDGIAKLAVRDVSHNEVRVLDGTDQARDPFVSPDGQWVAYFAGGSLKKGPIAGGAQITLAVTSGSSRGASWAGDRIVFGTGDPVTGVMSVPAAGGEAAALTRPDTAAGESDHLFPWLSPDASHVLYTATAGGDAAAIWALNLRNGERKVVIRGASSAQYVAPGTLLFATGSTLRAAQFNVRRMELTSEPVPVVERLYSTAQGGASYTVSNDGLLVYTTGVAASIVRRSLLWVSPDGREQPLPIDGRAFADPRLSADGKHAIVEIADVLDDVWTMDLARGTVTRQTFESGEDETPLWMPDAKTVAYASTRAGVARAIYRRRADGAGDEERLWSGPEHAHLESVTSDGKSLIVSTAPVNGAQMDLMMLPLEGDRKLQPLLKSPFSEYAARLSPDGRALAYVSEESGRPEVYVRSFPSLENKIQVSANGGAQPNWARNGRTLYFVTPQAVMAAPVVGGAAVTVGQPRRLFENRYFLKGAAHTGYDVADDGRFLMVREVPQQGDAAGPQHLLVVVNWFDELTARLK